MGEVPCSPTVTWTLGWPPTWATHTVFCMFSSTLALGMFLIFHSPPKFSLWFGFWAPREQQPFLTLRTSYGRLELGPQWPGWVSGGKV